MQNATSPNNLIDRWWWMVDGGLFAIKIEIQALKITPNNLIIIELVNLNKRNVNSTLIGVL